MKCPRCDADMANLKKCAKCGFNVDENQNNMEVEYKDFKTLELLEIRQKKQTASRGAESKIFTEKQTAADFAKQERDATPSHEAKKRSFPNLIVVIMILALVIGGVFLFRLLVQK